MHRSSDAISIMDKHLINIGANSKLDSLPDQYVEDPDPECLTISSGDEDEVEDPDTLVSTIGGPVISKEPTFLEVFEATEKSQIEGNEMTEEEIKSALEKEGDNHIILHCRTIRVGSHTVPNPFPVVVSKYGIQMKICNPIYGNLVALKISVSDMVRILVHSGKALPVIFCYVTIKKGAQIRQLLHMTEESDTYFDPGSKDSVNKRITLLFDELSECDKDTIRSFYPGDKVFHEISHHEANELLMSSTPREKMARVLRQVPPTVPIQTIMVFPPPPAKGGISINTEDYACLEEEQYLNDVIIDFYLKYLYLKVATEEQRQQTHIFSSFFYKRLTDKATPMPRDLKPSSGDTITPADVRHSRVKSWTKNIDLFSKDFIVIPLNENQHWFLAIICFPGLDGPINMVDNSPIDLNIEKTAKSESNEEENSKTANNAPANGEVIDSSLTTVPTKIIKKKSESLYSGDDNEFEDRDEAEGTDEESNHLSDGGDVSDNEFLEKVPIVGETPEPPPPKKMPIKQPCILIFDSLAGANRSRIINTLREYLKVEYKLKHGEDRDFSKNFVKGSCPKVPQQDNFTDCGLFVLQFVETFFEQPIEDYRIPIRSLVRWFDTAIVSKKRLEIQKLLHALMQEQNINVASLNLPNLHLDGSRSDEYGSDDESYFDEEDTSSIDDLHYDSERFEEHIARYSRNRGYSEDSDSEDECSHTLEVEYDGEEDEEFRDRSSDEMDCSETKMKGSSSKFHVFDCEDDEDLHDPDGLGDDIYGGMDDDSRNRTPLLVKTKIVECLQSRMGKNNGPSSGDHGEKESKPMEVEEDADYESDDQSLKDIEAKLVNSKVNRETVSISKVKTVKVADETAAVLQPQSQITTTPTTSSYASVEKNLKAAIRLNDLEDENAIERKRLKTDTDEQ